MEKTMSLAMEKYADLQAALEERGEAALQVGYSELAKTDVFFLLYFLLGRNHGAGNVAHEWIYQRCREFQQEPDNCLDLWAREHFKSTIITFAGTIQEVLKNPEITVGIFSHTRPIAKSFLGQIKAEFENNRMLKAVFPEILYAEPQRESPRWALDNGIIVKRKGNPKEATVEAWGLVDGQPTGRHFELMVYDDVVTRESVTTPDMIAKVTEAWELSLNLGSGIGRKRLIGTRYHAVDTYRAIIDKDIVKVRCYPATVDGNYDGEPVLLGKERLAQKRQEMGPYVFACQMLQDPVADNAQGFRPEWLRRVVRVPELLQMNLYILVDPASSKKASADYTVMWVVGLNSDNNYYLIDGVRDRLNLGQRTSHLNRLHRTYGITNSVAYEQYGQQADIEHIKSEMEREHYRFEIVPVGGKVAKIDRIRQLVPLFEAGKIYIPYDIPYIDIEGQRRNLAQELVDDEYSFFPVSKHDDMLDCLARILAPELNARFPHTGSGYRQMHQDIRAARAMYGNRGQNYQTQQDIRRY